MQFYIFSDGINSETLFQFNNNLSIEAKNANSITTFKRILNS